MSTPDMRWQLLLVLAFCFAWIAAVCHERQTFKRLASAIAGVWASWPPVLRALAAAFLVCCTLDAQKSGGTNQTAGASAGGAAGAPAAAPSAPSNQTSGGAAAMPAGAGAPAPALPTLADGTNCWWIAEGRSPADTDMDGMPDAWKRVFGLDPLDPSDAASDHDRDGLTALEEFLNRTHPRRRDTDGDGMPDAWEAAHRPFLCPWLPDDALDADEDGLDNFHEYALDCDPGDPDTNGDGRPDGEEADAGVNPALAPADWAAYGTALFSVRVDGLRAARRAGVSVGHITHSGVSKRTYALAAGESYTVTVTDLDPDNTNACSGTVTLWVDGATDISGLTSVSAAPGSAQSSGPGFTVTFPIGFPLPPDGGGGSGGGGGGLLTSGTVTFVGIDLDVPYTICCPVHAGDSFTATARIHPEGAQIPGWPSWSFSSGYVSPSAGAMSVTVVFDESFTDCGSGASAISLGTLSCRIGDRTVSRDISSCDVDDSEEEPDWDGQRFIAHLEEDTQPAELTYALAHSVNTVPFVWHGPSGDRVLSWEISGNARFLEDGQEKTRVKNAGSVAVLPKDVVGQSRITAKVRIGDRQTVTDTVLFGTVSLRAEPVHSFSIGPNINPCGLFVGDTAVLYLGADGVDPAHIRWSTRSGAVALGANSAGSLLIEQTISGAGPGADTVSANIDYLWGAGPPQYNLTVYAPEPPVPVHFMFICDTNGVHAGSASDIPSLIAGVNYIYRQAGIRFVQASVAYTNNQEWYQKSENDIIQREIVNSRIVTQGIEAYIVPSIATNVLGRNYGGQGLLIINTTSSYVFAHEIGHQCGWRDIYTSRTPSSSVSGPVSRDRLPMDWNNGPGPQEYYLRGLPHTTLIRRLLMFGAAAGGTDIPAGSVYGLDKQGTFGLVTVGVQSMDRTPAHNQ
jgi:hypothetical protein